MRYLVLLVLLLGFTSTAYAGISDDHYAWSSDWPNKEKKLWLIRARETKARESNKRKLSLLPRKNVSKREIRKNNVAGAALLGSYVLLCWSRKLRSFPPCIMGVGPEKPATLRSKVPEFFGCSGTISSGIWCLGQRLICPYSDLKIKAYSVNIENRCKKTWQQKPHAHFRRGSVPASTPRWIINHWVGHFWYPHNI